MYYYIERMRDNRHIRNVTKSRDTLVPETEDEEKRMNNTSCRFPALSVDRCSPIPSGP